MEQCGKRSRKCLASEDRITELPEDLLLRILSLLPTKDVIATSLLSKQWRSVWKMVPKLEFRISERLFDNVGRSLLSHTAPVLETLRLTVFWKCDAINVGIWIGIAFARHVRELEINLSFKEPVRFPSSLFISNTLETLKLNCSVLLDASTIVCMKSLKTLHLMRNVMYQNDASVDNLLSGCPSLENLLIHRPFFNSIANFNIVVPSLKTLSITDFTWERSAGGYVINTPTLKVLNIERLDGNKYFQIENASEVVEVKLSNVSKTGNQIWGSIKSVKRLSLSLSPLEIAYPTGVIFYQLAYLEMNTDKTNWWDLLMIMLDSSPKLKVLKLVDIYRQQYNPGMKWKEPKHVPECLLSQLETFVWIRYDWVRQEDEQVATYIQRNARRLKIAKFLTRHVRHT